MRLSTVILLLTIATSAAMADPRLWDVRGVPVCSDGRMEWDRACASKGIGYAAVVWSDMHTGDREIYAQLVDPSGNRLWNDGVRLTNDLHEQSQPVVTPTAGGWIVAWIDYRNIPRGGDNNAQGGELWLQKLNDRGQPLWAAGGIQVENIGPILRNSVRLISDAAGGAVLAWISHVQGSHDVCVERITSAGAAAWPVTVVNAYLDMYTLFNAAADGSGGLFITWDYANAIRACRIAADGTLPFGIATVRTVPNVSYGSAVSSDSSGGCYLGWYEATTQGNFEIHAQRLNSAGQIQWQTNGVLVCSVDAERAYPTVAPSLNAGVADGCLLVWYDRRNGSSTTTYYAQKLAPDGNTIWNANGILLTDSIMAYQTLSLVSDGSGGLVSTWEDERQMLRNVPQVGYDIRATRISATGQRVWSPGIVPVSLAAGDQWILAVLPQGNYFLVLFQNGQFAPQIRGVGLQLLDGTSGNRLLPGDGDAVIDRPTHDILSACAVPMSGGRTAVLWYENDVHYQILNGDGQATINSDTAVIRPDAEAWYCIATQAVPDGSGGFFAVLVSGDSEYGYTTYVAHVAADGHITGNGHARVLWEGTPWNYSIGGAIVTPDSAGGCYAAFGFYESPLSAFYVMRLNSDCGRIWGDPVQLDDVSVTVNGNAQIATEPDGQCLVAWQSYAVNACHVARVSDNREILWSVTLNDTTGWTESPTVLVDGQDGAYCTWLRTTSLQQGDYHVYAQHVAADGSFLWQLGGIRVSTLAGFEGQSRPLTDNAGNLIVIWAYAVPGTYERDIYAQKLSPDATPLWSATGVAVCTTPGSQLEPAVISDHADGAFVVWQDNSITRTHVAGTHLNGDGSCGPDPYWVPGAGGIISDTASEMFDIPLLVDGPDNSAVVLWAQDLDQSADRSFNFYAQRIVAAGLAAKEQPAPLPQAYALHQNYPNPFNPSTQISFDLPRAGLTKVIVFDILGREVTTLVNQPLSAGAHRVEFDASALASGIYFYRLQSGAFTSTRKMMVLK